MGVHQGEISRAAIKKLNNKVNKIKKNSYYIGYEANKFNIKKYRLASLNILCRAVVPKHYKSKRKSDCNFRSWRYWSRSRRY